MESHRYNGAIHAHFKNTHERKPTTKELLESATILHRVANYHRLAITEAVAIELRKPKLNVQREFDLILPSCRKRDRLATPFQNESSFPTPNPNEAPLPAIAPQGEEGGDAARGPGEERQGEPQVNDYVRLRLRPRTHQGRTTRTGVQTRTQNS